MNPHTEAFQLSIVSVGIHCPHAGIFAYTPSWSRNLQARKGLNSLAETKGIRWFMPILFLLVVNTLTAQKNARVDTIPLKDDLHWQYSKEIGFNMTQLTSMFIPFNFTEIDPGLVTLRTKWYGKSQAFRLELGMDLSSNFVTSEDRARFWLPMGPERRKHIRNSKWYYTTGWMLFGFSEMESFGGVGFGKPYALEYHLNDQLFISTDTALLLAIAGNGPIFRLRPPSNIFFNVRLFKEKK